MGAWIETIQSDIMSKYGMSHPVWVRGLKRHSRVYVVTLFIVAPCMDAWIETTCTAANG